MRAPFQAAKQPFALFRGEIRTHFLAISIPFWPLPPFSERRQASRMTPRPRYRRTINADGLFRRSPPAPRPLRTDRRATDALLRNAFAGRPRAGPRAPSGPGPGTRAGRLRPGADPPRSRRGLPDLLQRRLGPLGRTRP